MKCLLRLVLGAWLLIGIENVFADVICSGESAPLAIDLAQSSLVVPLGAEIEIEIDPFYSGTNEVAEVLIDGLAWNTSDALVSKRWMAGTPGFYHFSHQSGVGTDTGMIQSFTVEAYPTNGIVENLTCTLTNLLPTTYMMVTNVSVAEGVKAIHGEFFKGMGQLVSVALPLGVTSIGSSAFYNCSNLMTVVLPEGLKSIGSSAFYNCGSLTEIEIPASVTSVGSSAFAGCTNLTSVVISPGVTRMSSVFSCAQITNVTLVGEWTTIPDSMFVGCGNLSSIVIPEGVTSIGKLAFSGCSNLVSVTIPRSVTQIGTDAFLGVKNVPLTQGYLILDGWLCGFGEGCGTVIPGEQDLRGVVEGALSNCTALAAFAPGTNLTSIGENAFYGCVNMKSLDISSSVTNIGNQAFLGCSALTSLTIPGNVKGIGYWAFKNCTGLTSLGFEYGVESIGGEAFYQCWQLREVDLPSSVGFVGPMAFGGDSSIVRVGIRCDLSRLDQIFSSYKDVREVIVKPSSGMAVPGCFTNCIRLTAVRFLGDAPRMEGVFTNSVYDIYGRLTSRRYGQVNASTTFYQGTPSSLTTYVDVNSTGWDGVVGSHALPMAWPLTGSYRRSIAYWDVPTYLVKFDSYGGSLGVQDTYQYSEKPFQLPPTPTQSGYVFGGWWTAPTGGRRVTAETIFIEGCYTRVYAHWLKGHTIFLDPAGGEVESDQIVYLEQSVYGVLPTPVRRGYGFDGWRYNGMRLLPTTPIATLDDHTIRAAWQAYTYAVAFDANGGQGTMAEQPFAYGTDQALRANAFTRAGYKFVGWAETAESAAAYANGETVGNLTDVDGARVTLFAVWREQASVAEAANAPRLVFTTGAEESGWEADMATSHDGMASVRSGAIRNNETSTLATTVKGSGTLSFWARTSSEAYKGVPFDVLVVSIDGMERLRLGGEVGWTNVVLAVDRAGEHAVSWQYVKDEMDDETLVGEDCAWVDEVVWTRTSWTTGEILNDEARTFSASAVDWRIDEDVAHDGEAALRSPAIGDGERATFSTTVEGEGTVRFWWKTSSETFRGMLFDYATVSVDGVEQARLGGETTWTNVVLAVKGTGEHVVMWTYCKDDSGAAGADCVWVDEFVWMPGGAAEEIPVPGETVRVPRAWLASYPAIQTAAGGDAAAAVMQPTGKRDAAGAPLLVWHDFVAGTDPTKLDDLFTASIVFSNNAPVVTWSPNLNTNGAVRVYKVWGKARIDDADEAWAFPTNATHRFFKVTVEMLSNE